ncbi:MAG: hypothetical protein ACT4R6_11300 [Gemmatimonadaceae bacterium]
MTAPRPVETSAAPRKTPDEQLRPVLELAFAPLHKSAFGAAIGCVTALLIVTVTLVYLIAEHAREFPLGLLAQYFPGYTVSWSGALVGGLWGFAVGFVAGWFFAFCRNAALAITAFAIRTRAELAETRDFLDHI